MADGGFQEIDAVEFVPDFVERQEQRRAAGLHNACTSYWCSVVS